MKNDQTYFKNLRMLTPQDFQSMFDHFSPLYMKAILQTSTENNQYSKANHQLKQALRKREKLELANYADIKADYAKFISVYKKHHSTPFLGLAKNWAEYPHQNKFAGPVPMYPVHLCMPSLSFT